MLCQRTLAGLKFKALAENCGKRRNTNQGIFDTIASVALGQTALSHILNAAGEKLQKITADEKNTPATLIRTNQSVKAMVDFIPK